MADAQIAIIDGDQTQVVLAPGENPAIVSSIPGPQGPAGAGVPTGGAANEVLYKVSSTFGDTAWGPITSAMIGDLQIVNADVSASAAIAGTKISPNFGSQNVTTTGTSTAASFIPTSSTVPTNGVYLPAANSVALSTNGNGRLFINAAGEIGIAGNAASGYGLTVNGSLGNFQVSNNGAEVFFSRDSNNNIFANGGTSSQLTVGGRSAFSIQTGSTLTERLRITSTGQLSHIGAGSSGSPAVSFSGSAASNSLVVDSSSRVGIGTSSPDALLTVSGIGAFGAGAAGTPSIAATGDLNTGFWFPAADTIAASTGGTDRLRIVNNGFVGIGATSPAGRLHVAGINPQNVYIENTGDQIANVGALIYRMSGQDVAQIQAERVDVSGRGTHLKFSTARVATGTLTESLRIDSSGRVGIGTTSPSSLLHIAASTTPVFRIESKDTLVDTGESIGKLEFYSNDASAGGVGVGAFVDCVAENPGTLYGLRFGTGIPGSATNKLAIRYDGKVGIGDDSPDSTLTVKAPAGITPLRISGPSSEFARVDTSGRLLVGTSTSLNVGGGSGAQVQVAGTAANYLSVSRWTNSAVAGSIALGKSRGASPGTYSIAQNGDDLGYLYFAGDDGVDLQTVAASISAQVDGTPGADTMPGRLVFSTTSSTPGASPTEVMRLTSGRRMFLGTTTTLASAYLAQLSSFWGGGIWTEATGNGDASYVSRSPGNTLAMHFAALNDAGTIVYRVNQNGDVRNTNNSYGAISDIKLKENIVDANSQWDDLKALRVRNYNFKEGQTHTQIGLIAQEVELVSPGLVNEYADFDINSNDLGTVTKSVNYSVLYMKAVKALQEAMERIETLEAKVAALESP